MKKLFVAAALGAITSSIAAPTCVYRNGNNDGGTSNIVSYNLVTAGEQSERGDTITLAPGTPRNITEVMFGYSPDVTAPTGTETVTIRFYQENGTSTTSGAYTHNRPNTPIWDSGPVTIPKFGGRGYVRVPVPNVTVPDTFVITAQFQNVAGVAGNRLAWRYVGIPTVGTSDSSYWRKNSSADPWTLFNATYTNGTTQEGSFEFTLWADGGPVGVVYDNTQSDNRNYYFTPQFDINTSSSYVCGDDTYLEGSYRELTNIDLELYTDVTTPQGDEQIEVSFWAIDNSDNAAATAFYTTSAVAPNFGDGTPGFNITTIALPSVTVPDRFVTAIRVIGTSQVAGDQIGWRMRGAPNPGQSQIIFPYQNFGTGNVNGWLKFWFGNPTRDTTTWPTAGTYNNPVANFSFKLTASTTQKLEATAATVGPGTTIAGTSANVLLSDDVRWETRPGAILVATAFPERVTWTFKAKSSDATALSFTIESSATVSGIRQKIDILHDNGSYTNLEDFTGLPFGANPDRSVTLPVPGTLSDYIRADGTITVRTDHKNTTAVLVYPWRVRYDRVYMTHTAP